MIRIPLVGETFVRSSGVKRIKYVEETNVKEVKKLCPWAIMTYPHKDGHMAFETVAGFNDWKAGLKKV